MKKVLIWSAVGVVGVPVVVLATGAVLINSIDPKTLLAKVSQVVKQKNNRTLAFDGPVKLKWFPSIGADLSGVSLTEQNSTQTFLTAKNVSVSLALLPLFSKNVVVDAVKAEGVSVNVVKNKKGQFNFDDLAGGGAKSDTTGKNASETQPEPQEEKKASGGVPDFSVDQIDLQNLQLSYRDEQTGQVAQLKNFSLHSGVIKPDVPTELTFKGQVEVNKPEANVQINGGTKLTFGLKEAAYANLEKMTLAVKGEVEKQSASLEVKAGTLNVNAQTKAIKINEFSASGNGRLPEIGAFDFSVQAPGLDVNEKRAQGKLVNIKANLDQGERKLGLNLSLSDLTGSLQQAVSGNLSTHVDLTEGARTVNASLDSPLSVNVNEQSLNLANFKGQLDVKDPALPKQSASLPLKGSFSANNKSQTANLALNSSYEDTNFDLKALVTNFKSPAIKGSLVADALNLDTLLPKSEKKAASPSDTAAKGTEAKDTPVDLSFLKPLNLDFKTSIKSLKASGLTITNLRADLSAKGGRLNVSPLSANLYGGSTTGSMTADGNRNAVAIQQNMTNVDVQPLLKDLLNKEVAEGKGNVKLNLTTQGKSVNQMKANLDGTVAVDLKDGAIRGINLVQKLNEAKSFLQSGTTATQTSDTEQKTKFSAMSVSFNVKNGVATSNDLNVIAPYLKIGGKGQINLVNNSLDYLADASVLKTADNAGATVPDSSLSGLTVPVRVYGPFASVQWQLLFKDLAKAAVKAKLQPKIDEKKAELKQKAEDKVKDALKGFFSR